MTQARSVGASFTLVPPGQPDLLVSSVTRSGTWAVGGGATTNITAKNQGTGSTGAGFKGRVYLSVDEAVGNDTYLCEASFPTLNAGAQGGGACTAQIPSITKRAYYLIVVIDSGNAISESNESNNVWISSYTITIN
jgi:subtilase family serine protease